MHYSGIILQTQLSDNMPVQSVAVVRYEKYLTQVTLQQRELDLNQPLSYFNQKKITTRKNFTWFHRSTRVFSERHLSFTQVLLPAEYSGYVFPSLCIKLPQMWPGVLKPDAGVSGPKYIQSGVWFSQQARERERERERPLCHLSQVIKLMIFFIVCLLMLALSAFVPRARHGQQRLCSLSLFVWMATAQLGDDVKEEGPTDI